MPGAEGDPDAVPGENPGQDANPGGEATSSRPGISARHEHLVYYIEPKMHYLRETKNLGNAQ